MSDRDKKQLSPTVTVIMPAYNSEKFIEAAIQSVLNQTFTDWELLVIDDGSSDATRQIVSEMAEQDTRIHLHINDKNMGTASTRNKGLNMCSGQYAALLDSDDIWYPEKLEKQLVRIKREDADLVYSSYAIVDENGKKKCNDFIVPEKTDVHQMLKKNVIGCSTVLLSRRIFEHFQFSTDYYHEDYVLWLKALRKGRKAVGIKEVLVDYRFHTNGRASNKIASAKRRWQIYRSFMGLSVFRSMYYLLHYMFSGVFKYRKIVTGDIKYERKC